MILASLQATDWKSEHGYAIQIGVTGSIPQLNFIAAWLTENRSLPTLAVDNFEGVKDSILDGPDIKTRSCYKVPPTFSGGVELYRTLPELFSPILFLYLANGKIDPLFPYFVKLRHPSVVMGSVKACASLLNAAKLTAEPLFYNRGTVSIRVA